VPAWSRSSAAHAVLHHRDAGHRAGGRSAAVGLPGHVVAHHPGLPDRRHRRRAAGRLARQQRARLSQRGIPDRLLPLHAVLGADPAVPADLRRVGNQQGGHRRVRRAAHRAVQQRLRRDQCTQAARHGRQGDGRVALAGVQGCADLGEPAAHLRRAALGGVHGAGDRDRGRDVHRFRQRPRSSHHRLAAGAEREEHVCVDSSAGAGLCAEHGSSYREALQREIGMNFSSLFPERGQARIFVST
jgi:hypothetical protein